jgi:nucleotide-binding universal stress UspA family protein
LATVGVLAALYVVGRSGGEEASIYGGRTFTRDYGPARDSDRRIAVGIGQSDAAATVLGAALDVAAERHARVVVISAYAPEFEKDLRRERWNLPAEVAFEFSPTSNVERLLKWAADAAGERGLAVTTIASPGAPVEVLCRLASEQRVELIVVGEPSTPHHLVGSVAHSVTRHAPCKVVTVRTT